MSTIYILWLRQLKRYYRSPARIVASLAQPLLFLMALGFGIGPIYEKAGQGNYIQFLAPGVIGMTILFSSVFSGIELIWDRQFGFLKETLIAPVPRSLIMIGRTLGGATTSIMQGMLVLVFCIIAGFRFQNVASIPLAFLFMVLISLVFTSFGASVALKLTDFQGFQLVMNFLVMPMFFLSGSLFPLQLASPALRFVARCDPFAYGVDGLHHALLGTSHYGIWVDGAVLGVLATGFLLLSTRLFAKIQV